MTAATDTQTTKARKPLRGKLIGTVISDRRNQTRTVAVNYVAKHPRYGKYIRRRTKYQVHDANNESRAGDSVEIVGCRPISKTKFWRLTRIINTTNRTEP